MKEEYKEDRFKPIPDGLKDIIRSDDDYLIDAKKGDVGREFFIKNFERMGFKVIEDEKDMRHYKVWLAGKEKPNALLLLKENGEWVAKCCVKWGFRSGYSYDLNERTYYALIEYLARHPEIPIFSLWYIKKTKRAFFTTVPFKDLKTDTKRNFHDGNIKVREKGGVERFEKFFYKFRNLTNW